MSARFVHAHAYFDILFCWDCTVLHCSNCTPLCLVVVADPDDGMNAGTSPARLKQIVLEFLCSWSCTDNKLLPGATSSRRNVAPFA